MTTLDGSPLKVWAAQLEPADRCCPNTLPGELIIADRRGIVVACGSGALCITELQKAGGKRLQAAQFLAGHPLAAGSSLGT